MTTLNSKIYYEEYGNPNGQPIIFINGWGTDHKGLKTYSLEYYEKEYRCVFIDALGCGQSNFYEKSKHKIKDKKYICQQNADELISLIEDLSLKKVIIYGNCVGGWIATLTALKSKDNRIISIIFIDGFLYFDNEYLPFVLPIIKYPFYKFFFQSKIGLNLANAFVKFGKEITENQLLEQKQIKVNIALDYIKDMFEMEKAGYRKVLESLNISSLFITGEFTMPIIKKSQQFWIDNVKNSKQAIVTNSSHLTVSENPIELNNKILDYLDNIYGNKN